MDPKLIPALTQLGVRGVDIFTLFHRCCESNMKIFAALLTEAMASRIPLPDLQEMFRGFVAEAKPIPHD